MILPEEDLVVFVRIKPEYSLIVHVSPFNSGTKSLDLFDLLRRRRCFENAKPRRSAGGAQLNRSLGELEGPIRDPVSARFPKVAAFSSAESGSGEPPDRAQICAMMMLCWKPV